MGFYSLCYENKQCLESLPAEVICNNRVINISLALRLIGRQSAGEIIWKSIMKCDQIEISHVAASPLGGLLADHWLEKEVLLIAILSSAGRCDDSLRHWKDGHW